MTSRSFGDCGVPGTREGDDHWVRWHRAYDDPDSGLSRRLSIVTGHLAAAVDRCPPGDVRLVGFCAGEARDVVGALTAHRRRRDVRGRLVEKNPELVGTARAGVHAAGLSRIEVVEGDAGVTTSYRGAVPADVVVVCGVFGNISYVDIHRTIDLLPSLCAPHASVIWTRRRLPVDLTRTIHRWFAGAGYEPVCFEVVEGSPATVGVHSYRGPETPYRPGLAMFRFR